jgi:predicted nuclease of predicted toxin-antitoxin system
MKILIDMNLTPRWVVFLVTAGFEAIHWSAVGKADSPDATIVEYARIHGYCVLTHDLDFGTILALTNWDKPSVVQIRAEDTSPEANAKVLAEALTQLKDELDRGALLTVEPTRMRVRLLPFQSPI